MLSSCWECVARWNPSSSSPSTATGWVPACHWLELCTSCIHTSPSTATGSVPACHWLDLVLYFLHTHLSLSTATGWVPACHWLEFCTSCIHTYHRVLRLGGYQLVTGWTFVLLAYTLITEYCDWVGTSLSLAGVLYFLHTHLSPSTATGWVPACHWLDLVLYFLHTHLSLSTATGWVPACHWLEFCSSCIHTYHRVLRLGGYQLVTGWTLFFLHTHLSPSTATGWVPACHWLEFCTSCIHTYHRVLRLGGYQLVTGWSFVLLAYTLITEYCDWVGTSLSLAGVLYFLRTHLSLSRLLQLSTVYYCYQSITKINVCVCIYMFIW